MLPARVCPTATSCPVLRRKRALSDDEVHEAWGWPHEKVFKVGLENGASNEFGSNAAPAAQTIDAYGPLGEKSPNIPPGGTWTVTFFGATNEVGLAQLLTLTATAGSAVGTISASVNGTSVGSQTIFPGRTATWYVPGTAFKKGPNNTLTLTRTGGSGNVVVDSLSIGGSWQIGIEGQGGLRAESPRYLDLRHFAQALGACGEFRQLDIEQDVPRLASGTCGGELSNGI